MRADSQVVLTSLPADSQVAEAPKGLKQALSLAFSGMENSHLEAVQEPEWPVLVFAMAFIHSLVVSRTRYGPVGWSMPYDLRRNDLSACLSYLELTLRSAESRTQTGKLLIPWASMQQVCVFSCGRMDELAFMSLLEHVNLQASLVCGLPYLKICPSRSPMKT